MPQARIYTSGDTLPEGLMEDNFFHSPQFFALCQQTPRHRPYMVTVESDDGQIQAQMLAVVRYRTSWFPPYYYMHCRILGEGVYKAIEASPSSPKGDTSPAKQTNEAPSGAVGGPHYSARCFKHSPQSWARACSMWR